MTEVQVVVRPPDIPSKWDWTIPLTQGKVALVDEQDYESVLQYKWYAVEDGKTFYGRSRQAPGYATHVAMHRFILGLIDSVPEVDHWNRDGLDNRRCNLRIVTRAQNALNREAPLKGVVFDPRYKTRPFKVRYRGKYLGQFATRVEAELAYLTAREDDPDVI